MAYDRRIQIQKLNIETDEWEPYLTRHAEINLRTSNEYYDAGAERSTQKMTFRMRYSKRLKPIRRNTQIYRISYDETLWNITEYDDYKEQHQTVTLIASSYA